jgi:hypothetical protein
MKQPPYSAFRAAIPTVSSRTITQWQVVSNAVSPDLRFRDASKEQSKWQGRKMSL